jgi:hypothetical protein
MRILIAAVGRLRGGPEADLTADYLTRATQAGRAVALGPCALSEVEAPVSGDPDRDFGRPAGCGFVGVECGGGVEHCDH